MLKVTKSYFAEIEQILNNILFNHYDFTNKELYAINNDKRTEWIVNWQGSRYGI